MAFRMGEYCRNKFGGGIVGFDRKHEQDRFIDAIDEFFGGNLTEAALRETLFGIGVPADQIQRVLAGERLPSVSAG